MGAGISFQRDRSPCLSVACFHGGSISALCPCGHFLEESADVTTPERATCICCLTKFLFRSSSKPHPVPLGGPARPGLAGIKRTENTTVWPLQLWDRHTGPGRGLRGLPRGGGRGLDLGGGPTGPGCVSLALSASFPPLPSRWPSLSLAHDAAPCFSHI